MLAVCMVFCKWANGEWQIDKVERKIDLHDKMTDSLGLCCIWFDQRVNHQNEMRISVSLIKAI